MHNQSSSIVRKRLLGIPEAAAYLGVSEPTLKRHVRDGILPSLKLGRLRKFDRKALDAWIEHQTQPRAA